MTAAIEASNLYRFFHAGDDEALALRGASLHVQPGEVVAVTGPSGSGKSTLLSCIAGLDEPDGGTVRIAGERMTRRSEADRARLRMSSVGVLYQAGNLLGHLTVAQNVALARALARRSRRTGPNDDVLAAVDLAHRSTARPTTLSGGELARAGLAVALANDPAVLLADEPTGELDSVAAGRVLTLIRERAVRGTAVVVVTHDPEVASWADHQLTMADGMLS